MTLVEETLTVPAVAEQLDAVHETLGRFWTSVDRVAGRPVEVDPRAEFTLAVAEISANIIRHAYPAGTAPGPMRLRLRLFRRCIVACFADRGIAFKPRPATPTSDAGVDELPEGGLGLAICRAGLTRLRYHRTAGGTNRWLLLKQLPS